MLRHPVTVRSGTFAAAQGRLLGQFFPGLLEIALFAGQFLLKNMPAVAVTRLLRIFADPRKTGG